MDLAELRFKVDTKQLEDAAVKLEALGNAVQKLNKPMADNATATAKVVKEQAKAEEAAVKAAVAAEKLQKAQDKSTESTKKSISVLEKQNLILEYMAQGNSRGQASIMATYKAAGALDSQMLELNNTLKTQRTLIGGDPFDKSIGLMQKLQNEYKTTSEVTALFNRNLGLTEKQMTDIAREKERLIALYKIENKDIKGLSAEYENLIRQSVEINNQNDIRTSSMKNQMKAITDTTKANEYLAKELYRVDSALKEENQTLSSGTNNALLRFEKALQSSGMTAAEQTIKLEAYRQKLLQLQKASGNRQIDYLSRALGPQITDIMVGLATGQAPLTVMMQQGGQLRDQFALAGVAGKDMGKMLVEASKSMVSSVKDVTLAVGGLLTSMVVGAGKSIYDGIVAPFKRLSEANDALNKLNDGMISATRYQRLMELSSGKMLQSLMSLGIVAGTTAAIFAGVYLVALNKVIDQESELSKAVALTGGSLGLSQDKALSLSAAYAGSKGNIGSYVEAITEIAKAGYVTSDNLEKVAKTIVQVSKITGISAQELAKNFSKISEKPTEGLIPFAKELGTINLEILTQVRNLELAGKQTEAAKLATDAYSKSLKRAAEEMKADMGVFETVFYGIGAAAKSMWDSILNIGRKGTLQDQMKEATAGLIEAQKGKSWYSRFGRTNEEEIKYYEEIVTSLGKQINAQKQLGDEKAKNSADAIKFEKQIKDSKGATATVPKDLELESLKKRYSDQTKLVDSEFSKQQAMNKSNYDQGLIKAGQYLSEELRLIEEQNDAKLELNDKYFVDLKMARDAQLNRINAEFQRASGSARTPEDVSALTRQKETAIQSLKAAYDDLGNSVKTSNELIGDKSIEQSAKAMERVGEVTKTMYNDIASGANIGSMFDGALVGAGRFITALENIGITQEKVSAAHAANLKENANDFEKFAKNRDKINTASSYHEMKSYGDMLGGLKQYAKQGSKTYKALENAEKVYRVFQLAMSIKAAAANLMEGQTAAAAGVANQAKGEPYTAPVRMAAMAAIMAAIGFSVGAFGGGGNKAAPTNTGTGTVFGDSSAKSESLTNSLELLNDTELISLEYSQKMAKSLSNIENNISGFTNLLIRSSGLSNLTGSIQTGTLDTFITSTDKAIWKVMTAIPTMILPSVMNPINQLYGKIMGALWGKSVSITGAGISANSQSLGDVFSQGFQGSYYADVQTKKKALGFTYSTSNDTQYSALDTEIESQITKVFIGIGDAVKYGALALGRETDSVNKDISNFVISLGRIETKGLTGEEISSKLTNVFGAEADRLAQAIVPGLESLQKVGEGYYQTLSRTALQLEYVNLQTERLGNSTKLLGIEGSKAADSLINLFGSLSDFESSISDYYQTFYSAEERNARTLVELNTAFSDMGLTLPKTLQEYKALVNQQNLYTDAGRDTYSSLIKLSSGFADVTKAAEEAGVELSKTIKGLGKSISEWLTGLSISSSSGIVSLNTARSSYMNDLMLSKSNDTTALGNITNSAKTYLDAAKITSTSGSQYNAIVAKVVSQVSALPAVKNWNDEVLLKLGLISDYTDTTSTNTYDAYVQSVKQVDYLIRLNNDGLQSVFNAVSGSYSYYNTMIASLASIATDMTAIRNTPASSSGGGGGGGIFSSIGNAVQSVASKLSFGLFADGGVFGGQGIYSEPTMFMQPTGQMGVMGEAGPEAVMPLERLGDGALGIRAVTSIGSSGDSSMLWQAIDRLNANVDGLRAETRATVVNTSKTAKLLDRVVESDTIKVQTIVV